MNRQRTVALLAVLIVGLAFSAGVGTVAAQNPVTEEVNETYGGGFGDTAASITGTPDGGFVLAGTTTSFGSGLEDAWFIRTDANGNEQFNTTFGGLSTDTAASVVKTSGGGYALAGDTRSFGAGGQDAWLIKTDANGNEQFNRTFGGPDRDEARSVIQTSDGGFAMAGRTNSFGAGDADAWLIKTDANGMVEFTETFGGADFDGTLSVVQTSDGGFALSGTTASFGGGGDEAWLIKTDEDGDEQFNRTFGGAGSEELGRLVETSDGGFAISGRTTSFGAGDNDAWLVKTDANGMVEFTETFGGADSDFGGPIAESSEGGFVLSGLTNSFSSGLNNDALLVKTDANGNEVFNTTLGGPNFDLLSSVTETSDGGFAFAGSTESFGSGGRDAWFVKVSGKDGSASQNFDVTIDSTNSPVTEGETLTVTGTITNTGGQQDTQTITASASGFGPITRTVALDAGESTTETVSIPTSTGDAGTFTVTVESEDNTATETVTIEQDGAGGSLSSDNPFGDANNEPLSISDAADVLFQWNQNNGVVDGVNISLSDMADFLFEWNQART